MCTPKKAVQQASNSEEHLELRKAEDKKTQCKKVR